MRRETQILESGLIIVTSSRTSFGNQRHKIVRHFGFDHVTRNLKELGNRPNVPGIVGSVFFRNGTDTLGQQFLEKEIGRPRQELDQLLRDKFHIHWIGHAVQEIERLALKGLVRVFETIHDGQLVLGGILSVGFDNQGQSSDTQVLRLCDRL